MANPATTLTPVECETIAYALYDEFACGDRLEYIGANGTQQWFLHGELHRLDGPAFIGADGTQFWYINDKKYNFNDYCKKLKLSEEDIVFLKLKYNTCVPA